MTDLPLPRSLKPLKEDAPGNARQISIIGANGAGKSRFMQEMIDLCGDRAFSLNVLTAFFAENAEDTCPGSIDWLYRQATINLPYLRADAVSRLDKIFYLLFADELENLIELKEHRGKRVSHAPKSKFDKVRDVWERIFPGNRIVRRNGRIFFATGAGDDLIDASILSQGEKAVLFYLGGVLFAPENAVIFIDSPSLFIHPAILGNLWDTIEQLRSDCRFIYNSVDVDFVSSRSDNACLWIKSYNSERHAWDYDFLAATPLSDQLMVELAGSRRPVLFIEGDESNSIDMKLYSIVFPDRKVKPLGSCNKVIETVRSFNDLNAMHHLESRGIVDRDRRTDSEVEYLRQKQVFVPDVAEVENFFLLPEVVKIMARRRGKDPRRVADKVQREIMRLFRNHADAQALQHTRHKMKRDVECRIDARFTCITAMETHIRQLINKLQPRAYYNKLRREFFALVDNYDYYGVLRVFNHKPMLGQCNVHGMLGFKTPTEYIAATLEAMKGNDADAEKLRQAIRHSLHADLGGMAKPLNNKNIQITQ